MKKLIIIGTSTNARHIYHFVNYYKLYEIVGFAVDKEYKTDDRLFGINIYSIEELNLYFSKDEVELFVALLWNRLNADRRDLYYRIKADGWKLANIISPTAIIRGSVCGDNCWIHDNVIIQHDAVIHENVAMMAYTLVGDGCDIGAHSFLGAKCTIGGNSIVGEQTFVGINCTVFDDTKIGKKCILGACTDVKRNMPDYSAIKTSSEIVVKQYDETIIESKLLYKKNVR